MRLYVAVTDNRWFRFLAEQARRGLLEEVNFWRPYGRGFSALAPGELFLFKLHAPENRIAGGAFLARTVDWPLRMAWEAFGLANGVSGEIELLERMNRIRGRQADRLGPNDSITCIVLSEPFFFLPGDEIPTPSSFAGSIMTGKTYDTSKLDGQGLLEAVRERLPRASVAAPGPAIFQLREQGRFAAPAIVHPRLGQGGFRVSIADAYGRRCAMTGEKTPPALEAAHIRPYSDGGGHELANGILLRRDLHRLFDFGYLGIDPGERRILVSPRIRTEFENGRDYYALHGRPVILPRDPAALPAQEHLRYHAEHVFRG